LRIVSRRNARNVTAASATALICGRVGSCGHGNVPNTVSDVYRKVPPSEKLSQGDVDRYVRALHGIAGMDKDFGPTTPIVSTEA